MGADAAYTKVLKAVWEINVKSSAVWISSGDDSVNLALIEYGGEKKHLKSFSFKFK